ncbi:hypothetical protein CRG98_026636, partial [Punica granatum]
MDRFRSSDFPVSTIVVLQFRQAPRCTRDPHVLSLSVPRLFRLPFGQASYSKLDPSGSSSSSSSSSTVAYHRHLSETKPICLCPLSSLFLPRQPLKLIIKPRESTTFQGSTPSDPSPVGRQDRTLRPLRGPWARGSTAYLPPKPRT